MEKLQELGRPDKPLADSARQEFPHRRRDLAPETSRSDATLLACAGSSPVRSTNLSTSGVHGHSRLDVRGDGTRGSKAPPSSDYVNDRQVSELLGATAFADTLGNCLNAHLTIHWSLTSADDDPDGRLFARFRERFGKALKRRGLSFYAVWVREKHVGETDAQHCHLVFHLPFNRRVDIEQLAHGILDRLAGCTDHRVVKLTFPNNGDIRYLLKGSHPHRQEELQIKRKWRGYQGRIAWKRAGFTQNLGPTAQRRHAATQTAQRMIDGGRHV